MRAKYIWAATALLTSSAVNAIDFGVGVKGGTLGYGADVSIALTQTINFRASLSQANFSVDETIDIEDDLNSAVLDATVDLDFGSQALLFDWYVFDGTFHLTAGMMKNDSSVDLNGTLQNGQVTFDGTSYDVSTAFEDNGRMGGTINFGNSFEPYFGIGWGRKADDDPGLSLSIELGVVIMDPSVDLRAPTLAAGATDLDGNPVTQAELDAEVDNAEATANDDLKDFELYPVISLGLNYAF